MDKRDDRGYMSVAIGWVVALTLFATGAVFKTRTEKIRLKDLLEMNNIHNVAKVSAFVFLLFLLITPWAVHPLSPTAGRVPTWVSFGSLTLLCFAVMVICVTIFPQVSFFTIPVALFVYYMYVVGPVENASKTCEYTSLAMYLGGGILWALVYLTRHTKSAGLETLVDHVRSLYKSRDKIIIEAGDIL